VALVSRTESELREVADRITRDGGRGEAFAADVADFAAVKDMVASVEAAMGPIEVLMNNAGTHTGFGPTWEIGPDDWWLDVTVNLRSVFNCCHEVVPLLMEHGGGRIINMVGGGFSNPSPFMSGYGASKTAVMRFTETLAAEVKDHGIHVFAMSPGLVKTPLTMGNMEKPVVEKHLKLKAMFEAAKDIPPTVAAGIATELASGRFDAFTGRVFQPGNNLDEIERNSEAILSSDAMTLRLAGRR